MDNTLYLSILKFTTDLVTTVNGPSDLYLRVGRAHYVNIFIDSDNDIQICHYSDSDSENDIDGGGICETSDINDFFKDNSDKLSDADAQKLSTMIFEKSIYIYQLSL